MKGTEISSQVRREVYDRDSFDGCPCCVFCGSPRNIQIAHYISRGRGGKGIPQNLICLCADCHRALDNGSDILKRREIETIAREYLKAQYAPHWNEKDLVIGGRR